MHDNSSLQSSDIGVDSPYVDSVKTEALTEEIKVLFKKYDLPYPSMEYDYDGQLVIYTNIYDFSKAAMV